MATSHHEAVIHASPPSHNTTTSNEWAPFSGPRDFSANMVITLVVLFSALILGIAINFFIRFLLCSSRLRHSDDPEKHPPTDSLPTLVFSAGMTKLAGAEADCAICLAEFAEGDTVRVMPACNHGFHVRCIERWLASRLSCPTCRTTCCPAPPPGVSRVEAA